MRGRVVGQESPEVTSVAVGDAPGRLDFDRKEPVGQFDVPRPKPGFCFARTVDTVSATSLMIGRQLFRVFKFDPSTIGATS